MITVLISAGAQQHCARLYARTVMKAMQQEGLYIFIIYIYQIVK